MFKGKMETVQPLYEHLNILPLILNRKLLCANFMQKLVSKKHPIVIESKFPLRYNKSINKSANKKLTVLYFRTTLRVSSLMGTRQGQSRIFFPAHHGGVRTCIAAEKHLQIINKKYPAKST